MARVKTFTFGGTLVPGDLNSIEDDYESAFSTYKTLLTANGGAFGGLNALTASGVWLLTGGNAGYLIRPSSPQSFGAAPFLYLDPADFRGNTRSTYYRLRASTATNDNTPTLGYTITLGLYPVSASSGGVSSGAAQLGLTLGSVVAGSTVAVSPVTSGLSTNVGADFAAPVAGQYVLGLTASGTQNANSAIVVAVQLQMRQV